MKPIRTRIVWVGVAVVSGVLFTGAAHAVECSGYDVLVNQVADTIEVAKGHSLTVVRAYSIVLTDDPNNVYNLTTGECSGTILSTPDGASKASGHCARKDKAGDTYSIEWSQAPGAERGSWKAVGGTGKFAGKTSSGWFQDAVADGKMNVSKWGGVCQ